MEFPKDLCLFCHQRISDETPFTEHNKQQVSSVGLDEFRKNCEKFHVQWIDSGNGHDNKKLPLCDQCTDAYQCMVHLEAEAKQVEQLAKKFETCLRERIATGKDEGGTTGPSIPDCSDDEGLSKECNKKGFSTSHTPAPSTARSLPNEDNKESDDDTSQMEFSLPPDLEQELQFIRKDIDDGSFWREDDVEEPEDNQGQDTGGADGPTHITVIRGSPTMYQCNICKKRFKTMSHKNYHKFCVPGSHMPFKCDQCGKGFKSKGHFKYHRRVHTGERPFSCKICGKSFIQGGKLTRHKRSHTKEKPFVCLECNGSFVTAQGLKVHQMIHTGERPFGCNDCDKRFNRRSALRKHMVTHSGERPFSCDQCGKSFGLNCILKMHLKTHSEETPFKCDLCFWAFSSKKDLRRHLVVHTGEEPFKCAVCQRPFNRKDNLNRHFKSAHKE